MSSRNRHRMPGVEIVHEDREVVVIDKAPGLLTIEADDERERTAYRMLTDHVRKGCARSRERIFIVHRLDRETSGILVFARTEEAKRKLQDHWDTVDKTYLALVHGVPKAGEGVISTLLAENTALRVYVTQDAAKGKPARTAWRRLQDNGDRSLLGIDLLTGRKHQIRVHLAHIGHPVVGDRKYGPPEPGAKRLMLHAYSITFDHPHTGQRLTFKTEPPRWAAPGASSLNGDRS